jgi:hypothetical protein
MSTQAQIDANRENALKSTGPKTEAGKAASSQNNLRWGFHSEFKVLPGENQQEFRILFHRLVKEHQPATVTEEVLVDRIAQHIWLGQRAQRLQDAFLDDDKRLALYLRYQTTHNRAFHKCLAELLKLRAERQKQENGFVSQKRKEAEETRQQAAEKR